ncbi:hypothetical protein ASF66_04510 [Pseudomonas sp. Leaf129]|uniref:hypothetical protein n=1 Tax=Pseudomonas sp. Leaf129 TaxID=1736268 RepID=UPI000703338C|nr:hypothetical protein [Pseudomonas sp. Leaf129]KQQ63611.1 hypothetical protein ASF66_04510 [Pseudomonas sp. Leaf129]
MPSEPKLQPVESDQIHPNIRKLMAETMSQNADASKPFGEGKLLLIIVVIGISSAGGAVLGVLLAFSLKLH